MAGPRIFQWMASKEDEAGHSDERKFDLGDAAQVSAEPSDETGADGEQAEENGDRGNGYEIEVFVPRMRWEARGRRQWMQESRRCCREERARAMRRCEYAQKKWEGY